MNNESWEDLLTEVLANKHARCAYRQNELRRKLAAAFEDARKAKGLSVRALAAEMETSVSQVQRLLHMDLGGSITLTTICRAADVLELTVGIHVRRAASPGTTVVDFGRSGWTALTEVVPEPRLVSRPRFTTDGVAALATRWEPDTHAAQTSPAPERG